MAQHVASKFLSRPMVLPAVASSQDDPAVSELPREIGLRFPHGIVDRSVEIFRFFLSWSRPRQTLISDCGHLVR